VGDAGGALQDVVYAMWACGQHETHLDALAERACTRLPGALGSLSGGELAKLTFGLIEADVREVRPPPSMLQARSCTPRCTLHPTCSCTRGPSVATCQGLSVLAHPVRECLIRAQHGATDADGCSCIHSALRLRALRHPPWAAGPAPACMRSISWAPLRRGLAAAALQQICARMHNVRPYR
jgi:hypothetical protein